MTQYKFHLNNLRIAPRKVRLVTNLIKKSPALSAEAQLKFQIKKAALPILKLLKSAVASSINNFSLSPENLYISNILVDEGPKLKRFRARAFGRAGAIHKKTSHITLILEERVMVEVKKKKKVFEEIRPVKISEEILAGKEKEVTKEALRPRRFGKVEAPTGSSEEIKPRQSLRGITRKIFRRKVIG